MWGISKTLAFTVWMKDFLFRIDPQATPGALSWIHIWNLFHSTQPSRYSDSSVAVIQRIWLLSEWMVDLDIIHTILISQSCKMQELSGAPVVQSVSTQYLCKARAVRSGFHPDLRRKPGRPLSVPLRGQDMRLSQWGQRCSGRWKVGCGTSAESHMQQLGLP